MKINVLWVPEKRTGCNCLHALMIVNKICKYRSQLTIADVKCLLRVFFLSVLVKLQISLKAGTSLSKRRQDLKIDGTFFLRQRGVSHKIVLLDNFSGMV